MNTTINEASDIDLAFWCIIIYHCWCISKLVPIMLENLHVNITNAWCWWMNFQQECEPFICAAVYIQSQSTSWSLYNCNDDNVSIARFDGESMVKLLRAKKFSLQPSNRAKESIPQCLTRSERESIKSSKYHRNYTFITFSESLSHVAK